MRILLLLAAATLIAAPPETEIRAVLDASAAAWNRADIPTFVSYYENSPDLTFVGKTVSRGYDGVLERYRKAYPTPEAMGYLTFSGITVRLISKDLAIVVGRFHLKRTDAGGGDSSGIYTLVMKRFRAGWKIIHDHTSS
jgi:uncharacterized protein (TIGR02246 family)